MTHTTKTWSLVSLLGVLVFTGFGCKSSTGVANTPAARRVNLEYWTVFDDVDALQTQIAAFRAERAYINVNIRQFRAEDIYDRLVEALAEDRGPDIISVNNRSMGQYVSKLSPMPASAKDTTVVVQKGNFSDTTVVKMTDRFGLTPAQLEKEYVGAVANDAVMNGKIYGLPLSLDTMAIYYNKDLLDQAGVAEAPKTWEDFQAAVRKVTKYNRSTGAITQSGAALGTGANIPWSDDILYVLFRQSSLRFTDSSGRAVFNVRPSGGSQSDETPAMNIMNFYTDFANPTRDTYTWNDSMENALDAFVKGKVAFFFGYSFHTPLIKARAPQLNYDVMPLLQLNPDFPVNVANYSLQSVTAKSKNQNEAWNLVLYLTHSSATKNYLDKSGRPTALRTYIAAQRENPILAPFASQLLVATNWYRGRNYEAAAQAVRELMREWLIAPANPDRLFEARQGSLNRAAEKINQTL
jgi:multiple sugar transport system substrate-binding protein